MLYLLFFASGFAGLVYEVCWVREFGNEFGNTTYSASLVTAVFMCGLGVGSLGAGGWADKRAARAATLRSLLRAYGAAELGIAGFGLALACLLPRLGGLSALFSSYVRGPEGWFELSTGSNAFRYVTAIVLMAVPTFLMGATLTLLVRYVTARVPPSTSASDGAPRWAGWHIGAIYGVNTAGAAVGALLTDSLLVPRVGILRTQLVAVVVNVGVGLAALILARGARQSLPDEVAPASEAADPVSPDASAAATATAEPTDAKRPIVAACIALALSGFAALGMEIVWFRFLSVSLGAYRPVFSVLLTVVLVGICVGALAGGYCHRRFGHALELFVGAQALFGISSLAFMALFTKASGDAYGSAFVSILSVVGLPSLLMGFSFPLVNAHVQDSVASVGRRLGLLYLANTFGSVAGSLVAGFVLAPWLGGQASVVVFAGCAVVAPFALVAVAPKRGRALWGAALVSAAVSIPALAAWASLPSGFLLGRFLPTLPIPHRVLETREGTNEIVSIVEVEAGYRFLVTNGHPMSGTAISSQRYMRAFAHIPLLMSERPERALVICFGVGNTLRAVSLHPSLKSIEVADLSRNVLSHAGFFAEANQGVLTDPRVSVFVEDGRQHIRQQATDSYDLVTLEPPPIVFAGVASLYSREFYELVRSRLKPDGFMTQWLPAYQVPPETALSMVRAFVDVFPVSALLSGEGSELILIGTRRDALHLDLDQVDAGLRANSAVQESLQQVQMGTLTEIVGTFVADADAMRRATAGIRPVTDDWPIMEYTFGHDLEVPEALFATGGLKQFCPKCFLGDQPDPRVALLPRYMVALDHLYASRDFRRNSHPVVAEVNSDVADTISHSEYLRAAFGSPRTGWPSLPELRAQAAHNSDSPQALFALAYALARSGNLPEAARAYERGLALTPDDVEARYNLAVVYASSGREDEAVAQGQRVLAVQPKHAKARAMLCSLRGLACGP